MNINAMQLNRHIESMVTDNLLRSIESAVGTRTVTDLRPIIQNDALIGVEIVMRVTSLKYIASIDSIRAISRKYKMMPARLRRAIDDELSYDYCCVIL